MISYIVPLKNEKYSLEVQKCLFKLGHKWMDGCLTTNLHLIYSDACIYVGDYVLSYASRGGLNREGYGKSVKTLTDLKQMLREQENDLPN